MNARLSKIFSAELDGIRARVIEVEVDLGVGLHSFQIVGLADKALNEARERVNSALKNSGVKPPNRENRRITVNLAPADVRKTGSQYDLAIAVGYLMATGQMEHFDTGAALFLGELALDGRLRPISGALNIAEEAARRGFSLLYLPAENADEAVVIKNIKVIPVVSLRETIDAVEGKKQIAPHAFAERKRGTRNAPDLSDIKGQHHAKRALMIAAAGGHNILLSGPPGVGKSMSAHALAGILPELALDEAIEITKIYSAAGIAPGGLIADRPFRSPHHTASAVSIVGGGSNPKPGEISLAHRGVLFLDELPEFPKNILEALRQPLENGFVHVSRAKGTLAFPSLFTLVAAMNPCPCGYHGDQEKECRCSAYEVLRYQKKISGPLLDRIDLQVRVPRVALGELRGQSAETMTSAKARALVERARAAQAERFAGTGVSTNAEMGSRMAETHARLGKDAEQFLNDLDRARLSPRSFYKLIKTARTIADIEGDDAVRAEHLAEAYSYRLKEEV